MKDSRLVFNVKKPWLSLLTLGLAVGATLLDQLLSNRLIDSVRPLLTASVGVSWGIFGTAAFEYLRFRHDARRAANAIVSAFRTRADATFSNLVAHLDPETSLPVRLRPLLLAEEIIGLAREKRWAESYAKLNGHRNVFLQRTNRPRNLDEHDHQHLDTILRTNYEASAVYSGAAMLVQSTNDAVDVLIREMGSNDWQRTFEAFRKLCEMSRYLHLADDARSPEAKIHAYTVDAALVASVPRLSDSIVESSPGTSIPRQTVNAILAETLGIDEVSKIVEYAWERLDDTKGYDYAKVAVRNNCHTLQYGGTGAVVHPEGPQALLDCERTLATAESIFESELLYVRFNACVCMWRSGSIHRYWAAFDRCAGEIASPRASLTESERSYFRALADFITGRTESALEHVIAVASDPMGRHGWRVRMALRIVEQHQDNDAERFSLSVRKFALARRNLGADTPEAKCLLTMFPALFLLAPRRLPIYYTSIAGMPMG